MTLEPIADIFCADIDLPGEGGKAMGKRWAMLMACAVLAGCSPGADTKAADDAIASFHSDLNAGTFDRIYDGAGPELKAEATKARFEQILNAVHSKLGKFKNGKSTGWNDNMTTSGHFLTIGYQATYEKGTADENFVYRISGDRAALVGYHVNSDALLLG